MGKGDNKKTRKSKQGSEEESTANFDEVAVNAKSKRNSRKKEGGPKELLLSKENYTIMGIGLAIVILGFFLMSGGTNAPDEWKPEEIYSFTRITLAPMVILGGLGVVVLAIFKSSGSTGNIEHLES